MTARAGSEDAGSGGRPAIAVLGSFVGVMTVRAPRLPTRGETLLGSSLDVGPGGKGSNQAIGAARLGADVSIVACVGRDFFGGMALDLWERNGVDGRHVQQRADAPTGGAVCIVDPAGDNYIVGDPGANECLTPEDVRGFEGAIASSQIVMAQLELRPETIVEGFRIARRHGVRTLLDPGPFRPLPPELLALTDLLTPNETEARQLAGLPPDDATPIAEVADWLRRLGVDTLVLTLGGAGARLVSRGETLTVPGFLVDVVDVTGAGDGFNAALAVALCSGVELGPAVRFASAAGALAVTRIGVVPALPTRREIEDLMNASGADGGVA